MDSERDLVLIDQTPGEIVFLSAADTDLACVAQTWGPVFGERLRIAHAAPLRQPVAADDYVNRVVRPAKLVIARLLGGKAYFPHLIQAFSDLREEGERPKLLILPALEGDEGGLEQLCDFHENVRQRFFDYFKEGGLNNTMAAAAAAGMLLSGKLDALPEAEKMPDFGIHRRSGKAAAKHAVICFYRAWHQTGDIEVVDALFDALEGHGFCVTSFYAQTLRDIAAQNALLAAGPHDIVLTMQSFAIGLDGRDSFFEKIGCPVLQVPVASCGRDAWSKSSAGLPPAEIAMNVALPEIDGRVMTTVAGFKENDTPIPEAEFTIKRLKPANGQIKFITSLAEKWVALEKVTNAEKRVALILSNYPNKDGRIGNGVGLDTPASAINLLQALLARGYSVGPLPADGSELMAWLQAGVTNDLENSYGKPAENVFCTAEGEFPVAGIRLGNVFIGIQPSRGFSQNPQAIYHSPDLPPPLEYQMFYKWLREDFQAHAVVHLGKHGNLEWLPGRAVALASDDWPQSCLGPTPLIYPFIVNNPGEGTQAKRRSSAVIVDHLTPPLTRAGLYGDLDKMERLVEEHAHCVTLYPARAAELEREIEQSLSTVSWRNELPGTDLSAVGNFLCEIKESRIRSGLHVLGQEPAGEKQIDFLASLLRMPSAGRAGLLEALAGHDVDFEKLNAAQRDELETRSRDWIVEEIANPQRRNDNAALQNIHELLHEKLLPRLKQCGGEIENILRALEGKFIAPGPAGSPTRGRIDVLPTGRNFFAIDPRVIPTPTAWRCGQKLADQLLERHRQENGEYPKKIAMVIWGTSNMRTGGDDIAQALWLWGCEPVWEEASGRVVDFRIVPLSLLNRPRVDVLLRVSGLFRDALGDTMRLLATIPKRLAALDEPPEMNAVRASWLAERKSLIAEGADAGEAERRARLRVFSSGPGSYGSGLLPLIDAGNWESKQDLADVFCKWGGHAYDSDGRSDEDIELFKKRLGEIEVVHQNQDNREHDIFDSDDYFQFQGGLHASIEAISGRAPATYHGDSSQPDRPKIRTLREETIRVIRSRVLNPKWITAMREHGYKGAFEIAATVDYMFGYAATCDVIEPQHFEETARSLLLDPAQQEFFKKHNPSALKEASQRMLEAHERGLWKDAPDEMIAALQETVIDLQGQLE